MTCHLCSRVHRRGTKTFDVSRVRCAKNCTRKPIVVRPQPWVGKGICCVCSTPVPRGTRKCKNLGPCATRALSRMRVLPVTDDQVQAWHREAVTA